MKKMMVLVMMALCTVAAFGQQTKLVVTPLENRGSQLDEAALENLQDYLINSFVNNGRFQVPDRSALELLAKEQQFQLSDWADDRKSAQMGKILNANYLVRAIAMHDGETYVLAVRVLEINTASGLAAEEMEFTSQRDARGKMDSFVESLLRPFAGRITGMYRVGDWGPAGGWIFYDKGNNANGWRYLEAAPKSAEFTAQWGASGKDVSGTATGIGQGKQNTQTIVNFLRQIGESEKAAQRCALLNIGGFTGWFLPSKDELDLMYKNLKQKGLGGFSNNWYWSSSQYGSSLAWKQNFSDGSQGYDYKVNTYTVRSVRAF